jgi:hypothetical protein
MSKFLRLGKMAQGTILLIILAGCCAENLKVQHVLTSLAPGQSVAVRVSSRRTDQSTGLVVAAGERYSIVPDACHRWVDFFIPCTAAGYMTQWTEWYMRGFECKKPLPYRPWLALVGRIGDCHLKAFLIGTNWAGTANHGGELFLFANDAKGWYWNNFGEMPVTITRTK